MRYYHLTPLTVLGLFCLIGLLLCGTTASAQTPDRYNPGYGPEETLDSNVAFYEGELLNYVVYPPKGFKMLLDEAAAEGYSFAFVPKEASYDRADVMIGVNIYRIRGLAFADVLKEDTANLRHHYGEDIDIRPVDSIMAYTGDLFTTFYIDHKQAFIPNVMIAYFDGGSEILIFELVISEDALRVEAEEQYVGCLEKFKAMPEGELGAR
ncbi:hypothetical protein GF377_07185 [candidate division GN15 bacterium]|nr:hypothetical protein [candidate division GN15 bacterium]